MAANADRFKEEPKLLSAQDRLEALLMAEMNDERATLCASDQQALRKMFEMNATLFRRLAT